MHCRHINLLILRNVVIPEILLGLKDPPTRISITESRKIHLVMRSEVSIIASGRIFIIKSVKPPASFFLLFVACLESSNIIL
ncbi:hypothetical protein HanLR1_Chr13g0501331 [Helianthus annuus]|nr:hypothetical protein HanLR1_Chr13g0501331 [Helianthus annuus]